MPRPRSPFGFRSDACHRPVSDRRRRPAGPGHACGSRVRLVLTACLVLIPLAGCRWLPARQPAASLDPRTVSRAGLHANVGVGRGATPPPLVDPAASGEPAPLPQPGSPLRPVSDAEALASAPTPLLDAALARAQAIEAAARLTATTASAPAAPAEPPAPNPFTRPATAPPGPSLAAPTLAAPASNDPTPAPAPAPAPAEPQVVRTTTTTGAVGALAMAAPHMQPMPAPAETPTTLARVDRAPGLTPPGPGPEPKDATPTSRPGSLDARAENPETLWRSRLDGLLELARRQADRRPDPAAGVWPARLRLLSRVAEADGTDPLDPRPELWQALVSLLADAETRTGSGAAEPSATPEPAAADEPVTVAAETEPPLAIHELRFCRHVDGFGSYEPASADDLKPGASVMLYWEVEGLRAEIDGDWVRTRFAVDAAILPAAGQGDDPVWQQALGQDEDVCRRRRRDYFINCELTLPADLKPGHYRLRLSLRDRNASTQAERTLDFALQP